MGERASASAGIAIAHHLQPLSQVLEQAAEAEHDAKGSLVEMPFRSESLNVRANGWMPEPNGSMGPEWWNDPRVFVG